ncbi:MAG: hypothetical protein FWC93_02275 [Defluviitaleaceae bacterium]|nr:hypothetical protein [Defluviitaleaceae bacterium]
MEMNLKRAAQNLKIILPVALFSAAGLVGGVFLTSNSADIARREGNAFGGGIDTIFIENAYIANVVWGWTLISLGVVGLLMVVAMLYYRVKSRKIADAQI